MSDKAGEVTVGSLSEGEVLRRILARTGDRLASGDTLVGPGDDAAVLRAAGPIVATTDTLVHGPDFRLAWSSAFALGWKSAAVNLADVAAMGARPTALLVALAMPDDTAITFVEQLADGLREACDVLASGCAIAGGDLTVSPTLTVAVTALGALDDRRPVLRSGARVGDVIAICGELGAAARGLRVLFEQFTGADGEPVPYDVTRIGPDEAGWVRAQLRPSPPIASGTVAAQAGASAMMDVSDGLALDARRLAQASGVTLAFERAALGPHPAWAVDGGEDHALLATFPPGLELPDGFRAVGRAEPHDDVWVRFDGRAPVGRGGWDPYRDWDSRGG